MNFSDESDELLKQGVSKKQMIEHLRKGDFLDKASWAMLDKQSGGNDDLIFDFFKQNADNLNPRKATAQKPQELKLYDTSEYEKELKTRGFLENTARNLAASFDEDFNSDKNEQNKIALNIKEKIKHGQNFNDLSDFEKDYLAYRGSLDEWQSVLSPLDSAQKTGKFYKPLTSAWNTLFKSDEQNAQDAFKNLQAELKNQNAYKQAFDKIQNGAKFEDLSYDEKIAAALYTNKDGREKEFYENMSQNAVLFKEAYKDLKNTKFANVKSIDELSENEKKELYERQNVFSRAFAFSDESKNTLIQEELDEAKARKFKADFDLRKLGADLAVLEGFERKGLMTNAVANWAQGLFDKKGASEDEKKALQSYQNTMKAFGEAYNLDEIYADDKGRTHIVFEGQDFVIKDGGFQNFFKIMYESKFAVAGGVYGAIKGVKDSIKKGKISPKDVAYQSMKQSAIYSSVGGLGDYGVNVFKYDKDFDLRDALTYAVSEGVASVVGDAVVLGVGYGAKALYKGAKDGSLAQGARVVWQNTKKMADKISDNVVLAGFVKNLSNQNLRGAENLMAMNKDLKESINEAYERVGGRANVNETEFLQGAATSIKAKFGENSKEAKLAQGLCDIINLKSIKDRQKAMFEYIRADESGRSLAYLSEVANRSPQVQANLKTILNKTSYDLENKLKNLGIDEFDIKRVFDDFKNATGASYDEAMDGVLAKMYPSDIEKYRASVDLKGFENLISHFENEKMLVDDASKIFKSDIVDALFGKANKDGTRGESPKLSFTQLNNIRKNLNAYTKRLIESRPSFQNTLSLKVQAQLRGAIDEAIKDIFRQNPTAFSKASELYTTALKDYAQMKDLMKTIDDLRVASGTVDEKQAVQAIVKYASGQGEENLANLTRLTQHLSDDNKAVLEMNILQDIFNKSFFADKEVDIKVFDSAAFLDKLATLTGKDGQKAVFQSKAAKEFLKMVDDFHTLFKKDADIARRISPARSNNPFGNSNFATTASGKLAMLRIKLLFEVAMRNMPDVFWLPANWTNAFKSAALKYHLEHALTRSNTISEFKTNFTHNVKRSQHTPQTQRLIKQITQGLDGLENDAQELAKMSDDELALRGIFGENYAEFKGKRQEAVNHLLKTKSGQVQGAFYRQDLGDIDLVWGNDEIGLKKIISKHLSDFADFKGDTAQDKLANALSEIIAKGKLEKTHNGFNVNFNGYIVGLNRGWNENGVKIGDNKWIVTAFDNNKEISEKATATNFTRGAAQPQNLDEIIPNSNSQSQAPQKSLLEQARENTERLRAEQEAAQIAQKEAELARLKEIQAKNAEILAQKEAAANKAINEAQSLEIGTPIKAQKISDTKIIINDNTAPFKAEFIIAKKDDIKPNFERTGTQGRSQRQDKVIESIQSDFKPHLIFEQMGGFEGLPIVLKDGQVIAGNHRAQAIKGLTGENLTRYKQAAKEKFGIDLKDDEVIVRLVKDGDEKELINLAFMSNVGRESNLGEKALANLAKYESNMQNLPNHINAESVFELESQVAKALDTQGNGLNVFDTNLALLSKIAKNSSNTDILESLNTLKSLSQDEKEKVLRMFVSNAGEFHNLAKDTQLKSLNLNDYLADALIVAAKNVDEKTRKANFQSLFSDIQTMLASAKEMLKIDPFLFENFKSKALGYALARFARLENPAGKLFDFLKASKADLENLYTGGLFDTNKAISDIDIYDFLKHAINSGDDLMDNGVNLKHAITSKLDDLRKVENALIDSGEIQFAKSKAKPQGREAKETSINSLFADDELQMQATKPTKELNLSDEKDFNELGEFFKLNLKDKEFNEIYDKAAATAQRLGVKVRFDESAARSHFVLNDNTITIAAANKELFQAQDLLHELIHATTRKALKDFSQSPEQAAKIYTKRQIEAINEIISIYQKSKGIAKRQGKDAYALQNVDEFVAELSSSEFRAFLKAQDIFERFIKALIRFFTGDSERLAKNVNSYKALKESYYKILDDYEPPLVEKSVLDKNSEPQLAPNLSSDEILANSKAKSQGIFKDKTEQDYTNAYFQKLKKENPNLSDDKLLEEANDQAEFVRSSKNNIKLTTRIAKGYPKRDIRTEQELKDIYDEGSYFSLQQRREEIEDFYNITPLAEFGTNYAEFYRDGQGAVKKLLAEKQGQVAGAFYRQDLGDITLAWGKSYKDENGEWRGFGLAHILDKHGKEFKDLARELSEVVEKGVLVKESDDKIILKSPQHTIILGKKENDKFVITGYRQNNAKKLETTQTGGAGSFADETHPRNSLSSNQQEILPQNELKSQGEKEFLSPNGEDIFAKTTPEQRQQVVKNIQAEIDELTKNADDIHAQKAQIAKVANERAEMTGRYSRTSGEIKVVDTLNKELEKLEKDYNKLVTLQKFFKGDLSNDFWQFLRDFNNEKALKWYEKEINKRIKSVNSSENLGKSQGKANSMLESKKAYDSELKRLNNELEYTETLLGKINERGMIDKLNDLRNEILAQKRELLKQDPFKFQKVSHKVSHINQNNAIMSEISHKGGQDGTSNASNGLNAAEKGMPANEPAGISDGLFSQKQLLDEPRGAGADLSNSPTHRQQPQTLFSQGASEPNASGGQQRGSNERLRTASGDLRGEVSGDGQNLRAEKGYNVSERFKQDRSEQHSRAKHTIRANSGSGASHSNATATQELVSDTNAAGILSPAEKATIENQKFTQTIDPAKLDDFENVLNVIKENYDNFYENTLENVIGKIPLRYIVYKAEQGNRLAQEILENFSTGFEGRGYSGYSMSNNAVAAYENGQKPLSNFTKEDAEALSELTGKKWTLKEVKDFVKDSGEVGYHHTSKFYNTTNFYSIAEAIKNSDSNIFSDDILKKFNFKDEAKFKAIFEKQKDIDFKLSSARFYLDKLENDLSVDYERLLELKRYKDELEKLSATNYKEYKQLSKMQDDGLFDKAKAENERQIKKEQNATQKLNDKVNEFFEKHPKLRDSYDSFIYKKTDDDILKSFESNVYKVTRGDYEVNELSFGDKILLENLEETLKLRNYFNKKFDNKIDKKELENMIFSYYEKMSEQKIKDNANRYSTKQGLNFLERYKDFKEYIRYYDNLYKTYKENDYAADIYNIESIIKDLRHTLNKKGIDTKDLHIENLMPKQTIQ